MHYYGLFQVCDKTSNVAYRLKLLEGWKIHNGFHVSLLRPFVGDVAEDLVPEEQPEVEELDEILVPEHILAHKERKKHILAHKERKVRGKFARRYLEKRLSAIHRETEKLRVDIEKLHSEIRFEMDKVTAGQRLDLNLERGRIKEELAIRSAETSNLTNKLDKDFNALKLQLEASKYDVIKYCIGTIASVYALGLGLLRIFK
ncbi:hypothetical protein L7F22_000770 [Adiantum nelumboides]|nr:hypothetical protein [Adiantum nelumboides]